MRAVRSFDPCLPCGVHMYLGNGKVLQARHSPMFGVAGEQMTASPAVSSRHRRSGSSSWWSASPALRDEEARTTALELLQSMMDLHGAVISRIVEVLNSSEAGRASLAKLGCDPLVCGLLVLYGVHPVALEDRVARAVESVRPQLRKHGGSAELIAIADDVVRVKIQSRDTVAARRQTR